MHSYNASSLLRLHRIFTLLLGLITSSFFGNRCMDTHLSNTKYKLTTILRPFLVFSKSDGN